MAGGYPGGSHDLSRGGGGRSEPGYIEVICRGGKKALNGVINSISSLGVGESLQWDQPGTYRICPQCRAPVPPHLDFCTISCYNQYWQDYRHYHMHTTGRREALCRFPGCNKRCYVETAMGGYSRVHDYCGRTHAQEHQKMIGRAMPKERVTQRAPSYWRATFDWLRTGPLQFYAKDAPYYEFTNFYRASITLDGKEWPTSEHYFQAQKFLGTPYVEEIRKLPTARMVFDRSRDPRVFHWRRKDWEEVKIEVMYKALLAKFSQNKELRDLLDMTRDRDLVEDSPYDSYWGVGGAGTGENMLGRLLMKVRDDLRGKDTELPRPRPCLPSPVSQGGILNPTLPMQHPQGPPPRENEGGVAGTGRLATTQRQNSSSERTTMHDAANEYYPAPAVLHPSHVRSSGGKPDSDSPVEPMDTENSGGGRSTYI